MKKYKIAIVGATGLVGETLLKVLEERQIPNLEYTLFCSSKSAGKNINFMNCEYMTKELKEDSFDSGFNFAIFTANSEISKHYAPIAVSKGCLVIDNSSEFRMDKNVPLIVPEVNLKDIIKHNGIISNPNCSTIQAVVVLKPLDDKFKIKRIIYSTYQAVSGAGKLGLDDLINHAEGNNLKKFNQPIFNNCLPHIDLFLENGYTKEEMKLINETKKILNNYNLNITATAVRVPVENCHGESINIEFEKSFTLDEIYSVLKNSPNIIVQDNAVLSKYPTPVNVNGHNEVFVGRIRKDFSIENGLNLWVVADNLRKGAATNAVQILEKLISMEV